MNNETKQTAVDLLWSLIPESTQSFIEHQFNGYIQAKKMEKESIIKAYNEDLYVGLCGNIKFIDGEDYYNTIYGGNK
jgi:hypothetical protein